ncbi:glycerophosphodiester phosphodiesterase [Microbacterium sp.]|uniref:glycerophosphodiester phosphodiesterase n=1 Tax=Microbacterium sp. TaxID=51671 RepID=UPI0039E43459
MIPSRQADRLPALLIVCALAAVSLVIGMLGTTTARVSAQELMGAERVPGEAAFIAGHRGGSTTAPENTLPAVRSALDRGFDYVEVDLALTADGHAVLMHDATVDRTTDGTGRVADLTLAQIRELDAGSWFSPAFAGTRVPTAQELFDVLARENGRAILDLKGVWTADAAGTLVDELQTLGLDRQVAVASFDARTLAYIQARSEVISRLVILKMLPADVVEAALEVGARGVVVDRRALAARPEIVGALHAADLRVIVYTLNTDRQWNAVTSLGVDGIVTDDPALLHDWQRGLASG